MDVLHLKNYLNLIENEIGIVYIQNINYKV